MPGSERVSPIKVTDANQHYQHSATNSNFTNSGLAAAAAAQSPPNNYHPANNSSPAPVPPLTNGLACHPTSASATCHNTATGGGGDGGADYAVQACAGVLLPVGGQQPQPIGLDSLSSAGGGGLHPGSSHVTTQGDLSAGSTLVQEVVTNASVAPVQQQQQQPQPPVEANGGGGGGSGNSKASPRESGEDSEDESEILEESPCGRWLKRREEVSAITMFNRFSF